MEFLSLNLENQSPLPPKPNLLRQIIVVASIAAGVQFGWALQLSLLTPYAHLLGIPQASAAYILFCGPISEMLVQPIVGYYSDRCTSWFGRQRPFIALGTLAVAIAVLFIGYATDMGHMFGDSLEKNVRSRAIVIFVILDVVNNMLQTPCRELLANFAAGD
ncbi:hypothetical protein Ahy_B03g067700 isoform A [Arachis hypogaea]|uniref:Major facilitator superfamily (MFS) profile domain-containing protein n=1 Tax=Arachis hypogaea TaxID=3818 RepID=A0A445A7P3_ARAHY|nr:hypothetical protein Ahy_B03g067700 isoform A [Arachis hypogaea]